MFPKIYLELTNRCNLRCSFCPGTSRAPRFLSPGDFRLLAGKLVGKTEYLYLHVMGEPLLHPRLEEILDIGKELGFRLCLTTNGTLLPEKGPALLERAESIYKISISLHSAEANPELPGRVDPESYLENCISFQKEAGAKGILSVLRLWNGDGLRPGRNRNNDGILRRLHEVYPGDWKEVRGGPRMADKCYLEYGERFEWPDPEAPDYGERRFCMALRDHIGILCDGTVIPCCLDNDGRLGFGNLFESDLDTLLETPFARGMLQSFSEGKAPCDLCRRCGYSTRFPV